MSRKISSRPKRLRVWAAANPDRAVAIAAVVVGAILFAVVSLSQPNLSLRYQLAILILMLGCVVYLVARRRRPVLEPPVDTKAGSSVYLLSSALFFVLFAGSLICVATRAELYSRPLGYFIAVALMAAILGGEVLLVSLKRWQVGLTMAKILLLALSLRVTAQLLFPELIGIDPWWHQHLTMQIVETGRVPPGLGYSEFPILHIAIASTMLVTGVSYKIASIMSVGLLQTLSLVLVFMYGRFIYSSRVGLLASLILAIAVWNMRLGFWVRPITLAVILAMLVAYIVLRMHKHRSPRLMALGLIVVAALIITHIMSPVIMILAFFFLWVGFVIYRRSLRHEWDQRVILFCLLCAALLVSYWLYASYATPLRLLQNFVGTAASEGLRVERWEFSAYATAYLGTVDLETALSALGFFLFYGFAVIGSLSMLHRRAIDRYGFALLFAGWGVATVVYLSMFLELSMLVPARWQPFAEFFLAVPAAIGFLSLASAFRSKAFSAVIPALVIGIIAFFTITSSAANFDHPVYSKNTTVRLSYTESELQAAHTISRLYSGNVSTDLYYLWYFDGFSSMFLLPNEITPNLVSAEYEDIENLVVIREEVAERPFWINGPLKLDYDPRAVLPRQGFNRIYDSGSVTAFLHH